MALDEKRLAGLGVAPQTLRSLPELEGPKPRQLDHLAIQNGLSDLLDHEIKSLANSLPWKIGPSSVAPCGLDDVGSIQGTPLFSALDGKVWVKKCPFRKICGEEIRINGSSTKSVGADWGLRKIPKGREYFDAKRYISKAQEEGRRTPPFLLDLGGIGT